MPTLSAMMELLKLVIYMITTTLASFLELVISVSDYLLRLIRPPLQPEGNDANTVIYGSPFKFTYVTRDCLGYGAYGFVYKAVLDGAGNPSKFVAVKESFFNPGEYFAQPTNFDELCQKYPPLLTIKHENLIAYRQVLITRADLGGVSVKVVMDYYSDGDLAQYLKGLLERGEMLEKAKAIRFALDIARGLQHLHSKHIINGDLKPQNVLVHNLPDRETRLVICDLDGAIRMEGNKTCSRDFTQRHGTDGYRSPEVLKKFDARGMMRNAAGVLIGRSTDIWSLGCILVDFGNAMTGREPILHKGNHIVAAGVYQLSKWQWMHLLESGYVPYICDAIPSDFAAVARYCLQTDSGKRISARDLVAQLRNLETAEQHVGGRRLGSRVLVFVIALSVAAVLMVTGGILWL